MNHRILLCIFWGLISGCQCLRIVMVGVPSVAALGTGVELSCAFELGGETLYSVKWYKEDIEFFRFVPDDWPPAQFLPLPGVRVDLSRSGERTVYLRSVEKSSAGQYRCEVSAEGPDFRSVHADGELTILEVPSEGPRITGVRGEYSIGETVAVNCTSPPSATAPDVQWYLNGKLVEGEPWSEPFDENLEIRGSGLQFVVRDQHFDDDRRMRIRCSATIPPIYAMSDEHIARRHSPLYREKSIAKSGSNAKRKAAKQLPSTSGVALASSCSWYILVLFSVIQLRIT